MARQTLKSPVEIQVGGRSVVNEDITQYVEIRQPEDRFMRLLELLGDWQEQGKILVFVNSQEQCDKLFRDLLQVCTDPKTSCSGSHYTSECPERHCEGQQSGWPVLQALTALTCLLLFCGPLLILIRLVIRWPGEKSKVVIIS